MTEEERYSIGELEHMTGIKRRTIHHYISQGLLPQAVGSGPSAYYLQEHFLRLRLISLLGNVVRTDKIKRALDLWSEDEMQRMVDLADGRRVRDLDTLRSWLGRSWETKEDEPGGVRQRDAQTLGVSEGAVEFYRSNVARLGPDRDDTRERLPSAEAEESGHRIDLAAGDPAPPEEEASRRVQDRPAGYMPEQLVMGSIRQLDAPAPQKAMREPAISTWHRHQVHPDLEIQFRRRKDDLMFEKRLGELIAVASRLFAGFRDREEEANNDPQIEGKEKDHDEE
jgi:DNA-binding transcriptional MerR regulator